MIKLNQIMTTLGNVVSKVQEFAGGLLRDIRSDGSKRWRLVSLFACFNVVAIAGGTVQVMGGWWRAGITGALMAIGLGIAVQATMVTAASAWFRQRDRTALYVYFVGFCISVPFGAGFLQEHLNLAQLRAGDIYQQALTQGLDRLRALDGAYEAFVTTTANLAKHSQKMAEVEKNNGNTCDTALAGPGPRMKYRAEDERVLTNYNQHFSERRQVLKLMTRDAEGLLDMRTVNAERIARLREMVMRGNAFAEDPRVGQLKSWMATRIEEGRNGVIRDGGFFKCNDPILKQNGLALSRITLATMPMPDVPNPTVAGSSLIESYRMTFAAVSLQWGMVSTAQWVALLLGTLIDAATFFMIRAMHRGANPIKDMDIDGLAADSPSRQALGHVLGRSVRKGNRYLVSVPPDDERLRRIVCALEFSGLASYVGTRPRWYMPACLLAWLGVSSDKVEIYAVPVRGLLTWVVDPYRIEPPASDNKGSGTQVDSRVLPAGVTPIGSSHRTLDRKNHEEINPWLNPR